MNQYFIKCRNNQCDMMSWFGNPIIYDYGLFVNRTVDEHNCSNKQCFKTVQSRSAKYDYNKGESK